MGFRLLPDSTKEHGSTWFCFLESLRRSRREVDGLHRAGQWQEPVNETAERKPGA